MSTEHEDGFSASGPDGGSGEGGSGEGGAGAAGDTARMPAVPLAPPGQPPVTPAAFSSPPPPPPPPSPPSPPPGGPYGGGAFPPPPGLGSPHDSAGYPGYPGDPAPGARPRRGLNGLVAAVAAAALVAGGVGGGIGYWAAEYSDNASTTISGGVNPKDLNRPPNSVAGIANRALPSVVTIKTTGCQDGGTGSGFVFDAQGHIITNNHVIASVAAGCQLSVTFYDGKRFDAQVVGHAQGYDVAVIKLRNASGEKLQPLPLGNSNAVVVGDPAIAIGAPFGLSGTVTTGIISATRRPVSSSDGQGTTPSYMSALQTDAPINPGNSGGPLLNGSGDVIGINSAIQSANSDGAPFGGTSQGGSVGLGFAIPINEAKWVADTLIRTGQPVYAIMGMSVNMTYQGQGAQIATSTFNGSTITPGGPADKAGLKPGDVITKLDGTIINGGPTLIATIWEHHPGDQVQVTYQRGGRTSTTTVTLGERKGDES